MYPAPEDAPQTMILLPVNTAARLAVARNGRGGTAMGVQVSSSQVPPKNKLGLICPEAFGRDPAIRRAVRNAAVIALPMEDSLIIIFVFASGGAVRKDNSHCRV